LIQTIRSAAATLAVAATLAACGGGGSDPNPVAAPALSLSSDSLTFPATMAGAAAPDPQTVTISNSGGGTLALPTATVDYGGGPSGWLTATVAGAAAPFTLTVEASATVAPGAHTATIRLASAGASNMPDVIVDFEVTSNPDPVLSPSESSLSFTAQVGGANPAPRSVTIANAGGGTLATPTVASDAAWLTAAVTGATAPFTVTVSVDGSALAEGPYAGAITLTAAGTFNGPVAIPVSLTMSPAQVVTVSCSLPAEGVCWTQTSSEAAARGALEAACTAAGGQATACPTAGRLGPCILPDSPTLWFYPPFTVDSAALVCTGNGGAWGGPPTNVGTPEPVTMGCNFPSEAYCTDMTGLMTPYQKDALVSFCTSYGGAVVTTCSTANRLGTCTYTEGSVTYRDRYYTGSGATADSCFPGDVWTPN